jgi:hypothetical protein
MAGTQCLITSIRAKSPGVVSSEGVMGEGPYAGREEAAITCLKEAEDKRGWIGARQQGASMPCVAKGTREELGRGVGVPPLSNHSLKTRAIYVCFFRSFIVN